MSDRLDVPIQPGLIERLAAGVRYVTSGDPGAWNIWFGPGAPPQPQQPEVGGRQFDFQTSTNMNWTPRVGETVGFQTLRDLADGYDLLRLVITTRKDQLAKLEWTIKPKDDEAKPDARCKQIEDFLQRPDRVNNWDQWNRMFWEEVFVPDCLTILPQRTLGGDPFALSIIDGTTIKPIVGLDGRRPLEGAAYQQVIKGIPVADFTPQDLYYRPHEVRAHKIYGYSKVEQVITTVNIALRRQIYQLQYYTDGTKPDLIFSVPEGWSTKQTKEVSDWWKSEMSGNTKNRAAGAFLPFGVKPIDTKENALKDMFDEWLARIICYCFSVPPQALVKEQNRSVGETQKDMSKEEGLMPLMKFQKGVMDGILADFFGAPDLQFSWLQEVATNPVEQAAVDKSDIEAGIRTVNEVREERGLEPIAEEPLDPEALPEGTAPVGEKPQDAALNGQQITALLEVVQAKIPKDTAAAVIAASFPNLSPEQVSALVAGMPTEPEPDPEPPPPAPGTVPNLQGQPSAAPKNEPSTEPGETSTKLQKKAIKPINRQRKSVVKLQAKIQKTVTKFLAAQVQPVAKQLHAVMPESAEKLEKMSREEALAMLQELNLDWHELGDDLEAVLEAIAQDGAVAALAQIGVAATSDIVDQVNEKAVAWAEEHAAQLVKGLEETTLKAIRGDLAASIELGMSVDEIAAVLEKDYAFSEARAELIAQTERAFADVAGNMAAYRESGVVQGKEWVLGSEHPDGLDCNCEDNADAGVIGLDDAFPGGDDAPPDHPNCVCDVLPVVGEDTEGEKVAKFFQAAVVKSTQGVTAKAHAHVHAAIVPVVEGLKHDLAELTKAIQTQKPATRTVTIHRDPSGAVTGADIKEISDGE